MFVSKQPRSSQPPVRSAICGISPSLRFLGRRSVPSGTVVVAQDVGMSTVVVRRHFPSSTTRGMPLPVGTPFNVKAPVASVMATVT